MTLLATLPLPVILVLIGLVFLAAFIVSIRINNRVYAQRGEVARELSRLWEDATWSDKQAMLQRVDSVSYLKHLNTVLKREDWKELYRPEFFV